MIRIRQHGSDDLFDIPRFLEDVDQHFSVDAWEINIEWCTGDNSQSIEEETKGGKEYTDTDFRALYAGITQTIDGSFVVKSQGEVVATLLAVDSSFWEIHSDNAEFE